MKILLDENIPTKLKFNFNPIGEIFTVRDMNWLGKKNGELLGLAAFTGFEVFITLDKNLVNQQNLNKIQIKVVVLLAKDNKHQTLQPFVEKIKTLLMKENIPKFNEISI